MIAYPPTLPLEGVTTITSIIRERKVAEKKVQFGHCFWNVQGYAQKVLLGEPANLTSGFGAAREAKPEQIQEMADALDDLRNESGAYGATGDNDVESAGLLIVLQMIPVLLKALKELGWIKRKEQSFGGDGKSATAADLPKSPPSKSKS